VENFDLRQRFPVPRDNHPGLSSGETIKLTPLDSLHRRRSTRKVPGRAGLRPERHEIWRKATK
jgi:hypothetical protein